MSLKRKRSDTALPPSPSSPSSTTTTASSTPISFSFSSFSPPSGTSTTTTTSTTTSTTTHRVLFPPQNTPLAWPTLATLTPEQAAHDAPAPHLNSRTRKRLRPSRPADAVIYQHTLALLFGGARRAGLEFGGGEEAGVEEEMVGVEERPRGQASLWRFWGRPRSAPARMGEVGGEDEVMGGA
ncbi:MAG: hypothetical protein M1829_000057 [Trizodia sp. TS-e1964]|nr:MAG: hypothetical protein M1829_000057 [Trizodia sp. TS-e1964]